MLQIIISDTRMYAKGEIAGVVIESLINMFDGLYQGQDEEYSKRFQDNGIDLLFDFELKKYVIYIVTHDKLTLHQTVKLYTLSRNQVYSQTYEVQEKKFIRVVQDNNCGNKVKVSEHLLIVICIESGAIDIFYRKHNELKRMVQRSGFSNNGKNGLPAFFVGENVATIEHQSHNITQSYVFISQRYQQDQ